MKLGRCPTCNGKFQVAITWGDLGECIDCYMGRRISDMCCEQKKDLEL